MKRKLSEQEIKDLLKSESKRGRPLQRDDWGLRMEEVLGKAGPNGLTPKELKAQTGLEAHQIGLGARWLRDNSHDGPPVVYVPSWGRWFAASSWIEHMQPALREGFVQRAASLVFSLEKLASQSEDKWPEARKEIRRLVRDAERVREDAEDLVSALN